MLIQYWIRINTTLGTSCPFVLHDLLCVWFYEVLLKELESIAKSLGVDISKNIQEYEEGFGYNVSTVVGIMYTGASLNTDCVLILHSSCVHWFWYYIDHILVVWYYIDHILVVCCSPYSHLLLSCRPFGKSGMKRSHL